LLSSVSSAARISRTKLSAAEGEVQMKCKGCGREIDQVRVYSECWQDGTLEGNRVIVYGPIEEITETTAIECLECHTDLMDDVECC